MTFIPEARRDGCGTVNSQRERRGERHRERGREGERVREQQLGQDGKSKGEKQNKKLLQKGPICLGTAIFVFDSWTSYGDEIMMYRNRIQRCIMGYK